MFSAKLFLISENVFLINMSKMQLLFSTQDKVSYAVEIEGKEYTIHLEKNK